MTDPASVNKESELPVERCEAKGSFTENLSLEKAENLNNENTCTEADILPVDTYFHSIFGADTPDWTKTVVKTEKDIEPYSIEPEVCVKLEEIESSSSSASIPDQRPSSPDSKVFLSHKAYEQYQALLKAKIKCPNCFFTTCNRGNLKQHMKKHDKPHGYVYSCDICDFKTKYKNSLKSHVARHELKKQGISRRKK